MVLPRYVKLSVVVTGCLPMSGDGGVGISREVCYVLFFTLSRLPSLVVEVSGVSISNATYQDQTCWGNDWRHFFWLQYRHNSSHFNQFGVWVGILCRYHVDMGNGQIRRHFGNFRETMPVVAELTALQTIFLVCYSLTHYSKRVRTFDNNGCANYFLWRVEC